MAIYNLQRDTEDKRDVVKYEKKWKNLDLPPYVFKNPCSVFNQGDIGSCTAQSVMAAAYPYLRFIGSRLFHYYNCRLMDGTVNEDAGTTIRQSIKALNRYGVASEMDWRYIPKLWNTEPPKVAYERALRYEKRFEYERIPQTVEHLRYNLACGRHIVFGFMIHENFETHDFKKNAYMPAPQGATIGGHAVLCVGSDHKKEAFIVRNSWGNSWGQNGFFLMPYQFMTNEKICFDFWTITKLNSVTKIEEENDEPKPSDDTRNEASHCQLADFFKRCANRIRALCGY